MEREQEKFNELEKVGFDYCYIRIKDGVIHPEKTAQELIGYGFFPKGTKVRLDQRDSGWPEQRLYIKSLTSDGQILTVKKCKIGSTASYYTFEEIEGTHNSVMFKEVI